MRNLERLIARAHDMLACGLTQEEVKHELVARGTDPGLASWAVRGAKLDLDHRKELENAKLQG